MNTLARRSRRAVAGRPASVVVAWALVLLAGASAPCLIPVGCAPPGAEGAPEDELLLLEQLAFVPAGRAIPATLSGGSVDAVASPEALLVGMYEVTRGEFKRFALTSGIELDPLLAQRVDRWGEADAALPAVFLTRDEAEHYARSIGMRLPSSREWLYCALSPRALTYPWADAWQQGRANTLELGLSPKAATPVGTFEGGRTATHLYDLLGNVWEWASDDLYADAGPETQATAFGGSFSSYKQEMHREGAFFSQSLHPGTRLEDLGFRVAGFARAWLAAHAASLGRSQDARRRLEAVGRRWGNAAAPLLAELASNAPAGDEREALEALHDGARR
jgi:hypothetical protein